MGTVTLNGGDKLLTELKKRSKFKKELLVGFFPKSKYENGTYVASVAFWNEYGTVRIPPRPFFRTTLIANKNKWSNVLKSSVSSRGLNFAFENLGKVVVGDIKSNILAWSIPPNAQSTIKKKGFNNPLIDTMKMLDSVDMEIR